MGKTKIEWCDTVWNPVVGCTKVSEGCRNCYAERIFNRFHKGQKFTDVHCIPSRLEEPLRWKKPRRVFVNSMSDLFHPDVPFDFIDRVIYNAAKAWVYNRSTFMILTKRPERMLEWSQNAKMVKMPLWGIWLGVSVEDQKTADERIPILLQTPASVRFVSCEPILGPLELGHWLYERYGCNGEAPNKNCVECAWELNKIDWVIVGGESGPNARPMHPDWARALRDECKREDTPFFFKQWGEWFPLSQKAEKNLLYSSKPRIWLWMDNARSMRVGKDRAGRLLDGREWNEFANEKYASYP